MRTLLPVFLSGAALLTNFAAAQDPDAARAPKQQTQISTNDGGVSEVLQSIVVPPKPGAPFTLTLETEWVKQLYDGGTITLVNKRQIARDASGRVYQERWALVPKNDEHMKSFMTVKQIADPNVHTLYNCFMVSKKDTCELLEYSGSTTTIYKPETFTSGPLPGDRGTAVHDTLGKQFIAGVETEGTRNAVIYNPGVFGNDRKLTVEREFWYSPQLGLNLLSIRTDPRIGKQTFTVTSVTLGDPDPALFELPAGFKVVDLRPADRPQPKADVPQ